MTHCNRSSRIHSSSKRRMSKYSATVKRCCCSHYTVRNGICSILFTVVVTLFWKQQQQQQLKMITAYILTPTILQQQLKSSSFFPIEHDSIILVKASISSDETTATTTANTVIDEIRQQQQTSSSSFTRPSPTSTTATSSSSDLNKNKPTLYDILGVSSTATRQELKKSYVALARITHPDAIRIAESRKNENGAENAISTEYDFNDIATAYKILSDSKQRKRYDRTLQAEILTEQIASAVQNHPITEFTIKAIGSIAVPFFRSMNQQKQRPTVNKTEQQKSTVTTVSSPSTIASDDVTSSTSSSQEDSSMNSGSTILQEELSPVDNEIYAEPTPTVLSATTNYITAPIRDEYLAPNDITYNISGRTRKKQQLEEDIQSIYQQYVQTQEQLQEVVQQRISTALHTPNSNLNSNEAYMILNLYTNQNEDDKTTNKNALSNWGERFNFLRNNVEKEIQSLQNIEQEFIQQQQINTQAQSNYQQSIHDQFVIRQNLIYAERVEAEARKALEVAIENVKQQHMQYQQICETLSITENIALQTMNECERIQGNINKQSENVRNALLRKERELTLLKNSKNDGLELSSTLFPERNRISRNKIDDTNDKSINNKPEPPMSPTSSSTTSSPQLSSWITKSGFQLDSGWSKQEQERQQEQQSTTAVLEPNVSLSLNVMNVDSDDTSSTNENLPNEQHQQQLKYLRQREYEMKQTLINMEYQMTNLMEQLNQL